MKNKLAFTTIAFTVLATNAFAADLPRRAKPPAPVIVPPPFNWTGFYAGVNAGADIGSQKINNRSIIDSDGEASSLISDLKVSRTKLNSTGFVGGGQLGYNYQFAPGFSAVVGVEADFGAADVGHSRRVTDSVSNTINSTPITSILGYSAKSSGGFLGTVRGRVGYAFDNILVYGTGGLAYGQAGYRGTFTDQINYNGTLSDDGSVSVHNKKTRTGAAYGGGIEYALPAENFLNFFRSNAVTLRVEYLHYDLGAHSITEKSAATNGSTVRYKVRDFGDIVRVGLNYKFSGL